MIYSMDSSRMTGIFLGVLNFNQLFLKVDRFVCDYIFWGLISVGHMNSQ